MYRTSVKYEHIWGSSQRIEFAGNENVVVNQRLNESQSFLHEAFIYICHSFIKTFIDYFTLQLANEET